MAISSPTRETFSIVGGAEACTVRRKDLLEDITRSPVGSPPPGSVIVMVIVVEPVCPEIENKGEEVFSC